MEVVKIILVVLEVIASIALTVVVLLQSGKEAGLGAMAGGNNESYMGKNKAVGMDKLLASATKWIALAWLALTLALSMIG